MESNNIANPNHSLYKTISEINKDETKENVYSQNVESNGQTFKVTIHFTKGSTPSDAEIQQHMNDQISKLVVLANKMGLGNADSELNKIKASREKGITGVWHDNQGNKRSNNLIEEKTSQLGKLENVPENAEKIQTLQDQIAFLKRMTDLFKATIPPQQQPTSNPLTVPKKQPENQVIKNQEQPTGSLKEGKRASKQSDSNQSPLLQSQIKEVGGKVGQASKQNNTSDVLKENESTRFSQKSLLVQSQIKPIDVNQPVKTDKEKVEFDDSEESDVESLSSSEESDNESLEDKLLKQQNRMPANDINKRSSIRISQRIVDSASEEEDSSKSFGSIGFGSEYGDDEFGSISVGDDTPEVETAGIKSSTIKQSESVKNILPNSDTFVFSEVVNAKYLANQMNMLEMQKNQRILELNLHAYEQLSNVVPTSNDHEIEMQSPTQKSPAEIRAELQTQSLVLKQEVDAIQEQLANQLEDSLVRMTQNYNNAAELLAELKKDPSTNQEAIQDLEKDLETKRGQIADCNALAGQRNLPANDFTAVKARVYEIAAVVEKKLDLMEQMAIRDQKVKGNHKLSFKEQQEYKHIKKVLEKAPSAEAIYNKSNQVHMDLENAGDISSFQKAKDNNKADPDLEWGNSHLNIALTQASNWNNVHSASIKISKAGNAYVSVTKNTPLNINEAGGVPAGLRAKKGYDTRATNLIKTTTYLRGGSSSRVEPVPTYGEQVSFRGGQFPTVTAAREAIIQMMLNLPEGQTFEDLHINALLTPIMFTFVKEDKILLAEHKKNIIGAFDELINEMNLSINSTGEGIGKQENALSIGTVTNPDKLQENLQPMRDQLKEYLRYRETIQTLKDNLILSNFGVNEGAVGEMSVLTHRIKGGWHESIEKYSNEASQDLNKSLKNKLDRISENPSIDDLDHLGAILQVGHEMEAIWASNDYADARVGNNQFKMPALWKVMDGLTGRITYTNCMSGKDRTGEVESNAQHYKDEIEMNIADHKKALNAKFDQLSNELNIIEDYKIQWDAKRELLTAACFSEDDLAKLKTIILTQNYRFEDAVNALIKDKILHVNKGLGLDDGGLLKEKEMVSDGLFNVGTDGISKNIPKIDDKAYHAHRDHLPNVMTESIYQRPAINVISPSSDEMRILEDNQRIAVNRKLSLMSGSLNISQMNTSRSGFKMNVGEPLARTSAGFDRDYVLAMINKSTADLTLINNATEKNNLLNEFIRWTNLNELDVDTKNEYGKRFMELALNSGLSLEAKNKKLTALLKEIEVDKMVALSPKAKVHA